MKSALFMKPRSFTSKPGERVCTPVPTRQNPPEIFESPMFAEAPDNDVRVGSYVTWPASGRWK